MENLLECIEAFKALREEKNLSYEYLNQKFKIPLFVLRKLENDEDYIIENYPYSYLTLKTILKEYGKECQVKEIKPKIEPIEPIPESLFERYSSIVKAAFAFSLTVLFFFITKVIYKQPDEKLPDVDYNYTKIGLSEPVFLSKTTKKPDVRLLAKGNVWISAYIDEKIHIFNLKKGDTLPLNFNKKVYFQTIGNADKVVLLFNKKKIRFSQKIIHNLFVDASGVFKNGYNLAQGNG